MSLVCARHGKETTRGVYSTHAPPVVIARYLVSIQKLAKGTKGNRLGYFFYTADSDGSGSIDKVLQSRNKHHSSLNLSLLHCIALI